MSPEPCASSRISRSVSISSPIQNAHCPSSPNNRHPLRPLEAYLKGNPAKIAIAVARLAWPTDLLQWAATAHVSTAISRKPRQKLHAAQP